MCVWIDWYFESLYRSYTYVNSSFDTSDYPKTAPIEGVKSCAFRSISLNIDLSEFNNLQSIVFGSTIFSRFEQAWASLSLELVREIQRNFCRLLILSFAFSFWSVNGAKNDSPRSCKAFSGSSTSRSVRFVKTLTNRLIIVGPKFLTLGPGYRPR